MSDLVHNISLLGSTGSIGTQTLEIARRFSGLRITALTAHTNVDLLEKQIREFHPKIACMIDERKAEELKRRVADMDVRITAGEAGLCEAASAQEADIVVTSVVGIAGLAPTITAIRAKKDIALANKETLVTGGHIVMDMAREYGVRILPVDSEHSAIFQAMQGNRSKQLKKILLTASGGPFYGKKRAELMEITPEQALKHPNWDMGAKVTIDSSTLVNKGLEVIEAKWLFGVDMNQIEVLVHRQSIVHSMVQYVDNAVIAQLGTPDMKLPIQYALSYPERLPMTGNEIDFFACNELTFDKPDTETFPALALAYEAGTKGGLLPCVFNSADEAAVSLFLNGKIGYLEIAQLIEQAMKNEPMVINPSLEDILACDKRTKAYIHELV